MSTTNIKIPAVWVIRSFVSGIVLANGLLNGEGVRIVPTQAADIIYDKHRGLIYASSASPGAGTVLTIDPATAGIRGGVAVGGQPGLLEISDDGRYLYVALDPGGTVKRIDLERRSVDLEIAPDQEWSGLAVRVADMRVMPGDSSVVVVSYRRGDFTSPGYFGGAPWHRSI